MITLADLDVEPLANAAEGAVAGVSIARQRQIVPIGSAAATSVFRIASLTKPVTAVAVVRAAHARGIPLDTPVAEILPGAQALPRADPDVSITHLLSQTSGLAPNVDAGTVAGLVGDEPLLQAAHLVLDAGTVAQPGDRWEYYNGNYFVAGAVLAALHGKPYEVSMCDLVLEPSHMVHTAFAAPQALPGVEDGRVVQPEPYPWARRPSGGLCSTVPDLLTFTERILDDRDLLASVSACRTSAGDPQRYGLGWAIGPSGQLYLNGRLPGYRAAMMAVPEHQLAAVVLTNDSAALPPAAALLSRLQASLTGDDLAAAIESFAA